MDAKSNSISPDKIERIYLVKKQDAYFLFPMKVLELAVTYHWYDEIESGRKKEEYRDDTPYYRKRLMCPDSSYDVWKHYDAIRFRRGRFGKKTMLVKHEGTRLGFGNPEWGAPKDRKVFCLMLGDILEKKEV